MLPRFREALQPKDAGVTLTARFPGDRRVVAGDGDRVVDPEGKPRADDLCLGHLDERRVDVQRCPAVPTAPKTAPITVIFISASGVTIIALLPPSSNSDLPKRSPTVLPTIFPILILPVAEINGIRLSIVIISPTL